MPQCQLMTHNYLQPRQKWPFASIHLNPIDRKTRLSTEDVQESKKAFSGRGLNPRPPRIRKFNHISSAL